MAQNAEGAQVAAACLIDPLLRWTLADAIDARSSGAGVDFFLSAFLVDNRQPKTPKPKTEQETSSLDLVDLFRAQKVFPFVEIFRFLGEVIKADGSIAYAILPGGKTIDLKGLLDPKKNFDSFPIIRLYVPPSTLGALNKLLLDLDRKKPAESNVVVVVQFTHAPPVYPVLEYSVPEVHGRRDEIPLNNGTAPFDGSGVVIGVVDFGCDFVQDGFRDSSGATRIMTIWDQNDAKCPPSPGPWPSYGREITRLEIDDALNAPDPYGALNYDPDSHYVQPGPTGGAHGTHVLDIAAGNGLATRAPGIAPGADCMFVQARGPRPGSNVSGEINAAQVVDAVRYIFEHPYVMNTRPAVVNLSLAYNRGPHGLSSESDVPWLSPEAAIDRLLDGTKGRAVVVAAGNGRGGAWHASGAFRADKPRVLQWEFAPAGENLPQFNTLQLYPSVSGTPDPLEVWITPPNGGDPIAVPPNTDVPLIDNGRTVGRARYDFLLLVHHPLRRERLTLRIKDKDYVAARTAGPGAGTFAAIWKIQVGLPRSGVSEFHAWVDCADPFQSQFSQKDSDPNYTLSALASGRNTIVVGAYDAVSQVRAAGSFSSAGPTVDNRPKPDLAAPGVGIWAARSKGNIPTEPGSPWRTSAAVMKSGTSMAAPHVAGAAALIFQKTPNASFDEIRDRLNETARKHPPSLDRTRRWDPVFGHGRLDVQAALGKP